MRINKDEYYLGVAKAVSKRSTWCNYDQGYIEKEEYDDLELKIRKIDDICNKKWKCQRINKKVKYDRT